MVKAWRQVFRWAAPEAVVFEYAPTALLAARGLQMLRVMFGVGFSSPPRAHPLPSFRPWEEVPVQRLESSESLVLDCINWVLAKLDEPGLDALHELFDVDDDFLCTFPELDHYGPRAAAQYCGPIFPADNGSTPTWPNVGKKKIYVYIRPGMRSFIHLAKALNALPYSVLWIAPGVDTSLMRRFESPTLKFMREPVQLSAAFTQADAAVLYGSHGMTSAALLVGIPLVLCPNHVEQMLISRNVARLGACVLIPSVAKAGQVHVALRTVSDDPRYKQRASAFASKYQPFDPQQAIARVAARIVDLCAARG